MKILGFELPGAVTSMFARDAAPAIQQATPIAVTKDVGSFVSPNNAMLFGQGYYPSNTGEPVTALTSLQHDAVYACVRALSSDIARLPLHLMQRLEPRGNRVMRNHPLVELLREPNPWQSTFDFMAYLVSSQQLRGNAYCWIRRDEAGEPFQLIPLHPDRVTVMWNPQIRGQLIYRFTSSVFQGEQFTVPDEDILHVRNSMSVDDGGALGVSAIAAGQNTIALGLAVKKSAAILFKQGAQIRGVLNAPDSFKSTPETIQRMASSWQEAYSGNESAHKVAFLEGGVTFQPVAWSAQDSQMIEARRLCTEDIARLFNVPLHRIQDMERSTNNNVEQQARDYVDNSLIPIAIAFEQQFARKLLFKAERASLYFAFDFDELLRGDTKTRYDAHAIALLNGIKTRNEVRAEEGLNPVEGGDTFRVPSNTLDPDAKPTPDTPEVISPPMANPQDEPEESVDSDDNGDA